MNKNMININVELLQQFANFDKKSAKRVKTSDATHTETPINSKSDPEN